jgi:hypothetical protein
MTSRVFSLGCVVVLGLAVGDGSLAMRPDTSAQLRPVWTETVWPFLLDAWGPGRAFRCEASACGTAVAVTIRPKVGFCNCSVGVADDDEIDRVGDVALISDRYRPLELGKPAAVGDMRGRSRVFMTDGPMTPVGYALGVALAKKCDAVVALVAANQPISPTIERAALAFLASDQVARWVEASLGSQ